ncbi:MAG: hypothetical protein AUK53_00905 [Betaproteobacteria bacterium CG2_30_59_46]|nr:MAG: hypothetical protein AUK53_00905 [Betaproteobacteria bacterium CG2_30_59_46]
MRVLLAEDDPLLGDGVQKSPGHPGFTVDWRVVLDEWLRQGIATLDEHDKVHLAADAFVSPQGIVDH